MELVLSDHTPQHRLFEIGAILKGIHGLLELIGGIMLYIVSGTTIVNIISSIVGGELREDPNDVLANIIVNHAHVTTAGKDFVALYLLVSALVNIGMAIGLLLHKKRMFPLAIMILGAFVAYQILLYSRTHSLVLIVLALYDMFLIWLVQSEYRRRWPHQESPRFVP